MYPLLTMHLEVPTFRADLTGFQFVLALIKGNIKRHCS